MEIPAGREARELGNLTDHFHVRCHKLREKRPGTDYKGPRRHKINGLEYATILISSEMTSTLRALSLFAKLHRSLNSFFAFS